MAEILGIFRASEIEVLDRVLDKGIVIDASARISLVGIDLITVEACITVASIATNLQHSDEEWLRKLLDELEK